MAAFANKSGRLVGALLRHSIDPNFSLSHWKNCYIFRNGGQYLARSCLNVALMGETMGKVNARHLNSFT